MFVPEGMNRRYSKITINNFVELVKPLSCEQFLYDDDDDDDKCM